MPVAAGEIRTIRAERKVELGLSPWRRPAGQRPMDFSCGLDTELPRLLGKLKHL